MPTNRRLSILAIALAAVVITAAPAAFAHRAASGVNAFVVRNLVSSGYLAGATADPNLVNAWGLAASATGPWWISNEATGTSTVYDGTGQKRSTRGDRGRRPDRNGRQRHDRVRREGRPGVGARALHLRVRGREDPRLGRKCPGRWLQRHRGCGRQLSSGGRLSRARRGHGARWLHLPLRGRLPRRTRRCLRLELAADHVERRLRRPQDPRLVQRVRDPGDRRPDLRHLRLAGPAERERRADRRVCGRLRPEREVARASRTDGPAERAGRRRDRTAYLREIRRRSARRQLRRRPHRRLPRSGNRTAGRILARCGGRTAR